MRATELKPGGPVELEFGGAVEHVYRVALAKGQLVTISLESHDADLTAALYGPDGTPLAEVSRLKDTLVPEPLSAVTVSGGDHRLVIRATAYGAGRGGYAAGVQELRAARPGDERRVAAERATARGAQLQYAVGTAEANRRAVEQYRSALSHWRAVGDRGREAAALGSIAAALSSLGDFAGAVEHYRRGADVLQAAGEVRKEAAVREDIGWIYYRFLKDRQNALDSYERALSLYASLGRGDGASIEQLARTNNIIGMIHSDLGQGPPERKKAVENFSEALGLYREAKNRYGEGDTLSNIMVTYGRLQQPQVAVYFGKQAVNVYQSLRANIQDYKLERETHKTFVRSKEETYRVLADLLIAQGRLPEAKQVLDMLKEEEYFSYTRSESGDSSSGGGASLSPGEAEQERQFKKIAGRLTASGRMYRELLGKDTRTPEEELKLGELEADLRLARQAFQSYLEKLEDELGDTRQAGRVEQLREAQALKEDLRELGPDAVALYTLVTEDKYRLILITPEFEKAYEHPVKAADLARKVAAFRDALQDPHSDPLPLARELYQIVLKPVADDLQAAGASTLMWSLDGVLRYLPIAALHDGGGYMVERFRNVIFTPASLARLKDQPGRNWKGLGFGVTKEHANFLPLPGVGEELRGIIYDEAEPEKREGIMPGRIYLDASFNEENTVKALRLGYQLVHVASHFVFNPGTIDNSFLLLGDGRHMPLSEIKTSLTFRGVDLLTLSACDTATGAPGADGKEVDSFAMMAQRQGAKAIIASLWPVSDDSTKLLMQKFHHARARNPEVTKVEALRLAQLSLAHGRDDAVPVAGGERGLGVSTAAGKPGGARPPGGFARSFAHPFYWAPFILIGNWK